MERDAAKEHLGQEIAFARPPRDRKGERYLGIHPAGDAHAGEVGQQGGATEHRQRQQQEAQGAPGETLGGRHREGQEPGIAPPAAGLPQEAAAGEGHEGAEKQGGERADGVPQLVCSLQGFFHDEVAERVRSFASVDAGRKLLQETALGAEVEPDESCGHCEIEDEAGAEGGGEVLAEVFSDKGPEACRMKV